MINNRRDLSAAARHGGLSFREGLLIRSGNLSSAEPAELDGISVVIDLRTQMEADRTPDRLAEWVSYYHIPLFDESAAGITREKNLSEVPDMRNLYRVMLEDESCRNQLLSVLRLIFTHDYSRGAVLWHCTAGKDRCGIVSALVYITLGLDRESIMCDYLRSNEFCEKEGDEACRKLLQAGKPESLALAVREAYLARPEYLQAALSAFDRNPVRLPEAEQFRRTVLQS